MCAEGVGEHAGWKRKGIGAGKPSAQLWRDFWPQAVGLQSLVSQDGDANPITEELGCAQQGRNLHPGTSQRVLGNAVLGQDGQAAWGIRSLGFKSQAQWAAGGLRSPDPSPGCLLQHPALGTVQAGTCLRSLACPGLLPSSAIICFL